MKKPKPKKLSPAQKKAALMSLYGGLMANFLYTIKTDKRVPDDVRARAEDLQVKWETVSPYKPLNPITIIELEKALKS